MNRYINALGDAGKCRSLVEYSRHSDTIMVIRARRISQLEKNLRLNVAAGGRSIELHPLTFHPVQDFCRSRVRIRQAQQLNQALKDGANHGPLASSSAARDLKVTFVKQQRRNKP